MSQINEPSLAAGEEAIKFCPFCGEEFSEFLKLNVPHLCPEEGGCGTKFAVYRKK